MTTEDKIIAYFAGELSLAERKALLKEISTSPKALQIFHEHQVLRGMAMESAATIHAPAFDASKFQGVPVATSHSFRSRRLVPLLAVFLLLASVGSTAWYFSQTEEPGKASVFSKTTTTSSGLANNTTEPIENSDHSIAIGHHSAKRIVENKEGVLPDVAAVRSNDEPIATPVLTEPLIDLASMGNADIRDIGGSISRSEGIHSLDEMRFHRVEKGSLFEVSLQTASGFTYPSDAQPVKALSGERLSLGYHITSSEVVGLRLTSALYQLPGSIRSSDEGGVTLLTQSLETRRAFGGEVFASHEFFGAFGTPVTAVVTIAGGLIPSGFSVAAEAGLRIPATENLSFSVDFALARIHSDIARPDAVINSAETLGGPVTYYGPNIRTTINGSLLYGISYNF